jgi:hypothetical protein
MSSGRTWLFAYFNGVEKDGDVLSEYLYCTWRGLIKSMITNTLIWFYRNVWLHRRATGLHLRRLGSHLSLEMTKTSACSMIWVHFSRIDRRDSLAWPSAVHRGDSPVAYDGEWHLNDLDWLIFTSFVLKGSSGRTACRRMVASTGWWHLDGEEEFYLLFPPGYPSSLSPGLDIWGLISMIDWWFERGGGALILLYHPPPT